MATTAITGADVIIKVDSVVVAGQRDARISGSTDMIDMTCKTDYPNKVMRPGWNGEATVECDALLATGDYGYKYWYDLAIAQEPVELEIDLGDGDGTVMGNGGSAAEVGTANAYVQVPELSAAQAGEGTMSLKFTIYGPITWA